MRVEVEVVQVVVVLVVELELVLKVSVGGVGGGGVRGGSCQGGCRGDGLMLVVAALALEDANVAVAPHPAGLPGGTTERGRSC